ncbi:MAG TPA: glutathione S-transferase [Porticoccaceae bacterium]|jgi:glutathione S-transferase|nr:glutathione S-transferase [Porticoccaceae bacterium]
MKLHEFAAAPNARRVAIFLAEKGIEIETVQVDLRAGEHKSPEYTAFNPLQDVPALELDDGSCLNQVNAICHYLDEIYPDNPLYGRTPLERAQAESWNHFVQMNGLMAVAEAFRNSTPGFKDRALAGPHQYAQIPELATRGLTRLNDFFADMNTHFASNEFVLGDYFSVVDITGFMTTDFAGWVKVSIPEDYTHLQRWFDQMSARPSIKG